MEPNMVSHPKAQFIVFIVSTVHCPV